MSKALEGEHLCLKHQGNHSHYAEHNCTICKLQAATSAADARYQARVRELEEAADAVLEEARMGVLTLSTAAKLRLMITVGKTPDTALQRKVLEARIDECTNAHTDERFNELRAQLAALGELK